MYLYFKPVAPGNCAVKVDNSKVPSASTGISTGFSSPSSATYIFNKTSTLCLVWHAGAFRWQCYLHVSSMWFVLHNTVVDIVLSWDNTVIIRIKNIQ